MSVWQAAQAVQLYNLRRLVDDLERQHPKTVPCHKCGKQIPVKQIIIRDYKVICEKCYQEIYISKNQQLK